MEAHMNPFALKSWKERRQYSSGHAMDIRLASKYLLQVFMTIQIIRPCLIESLSTESNPKEKNYKNDPRGRHI